MKEIWRREGSYPLLSTVFFFLICLISSSSGANQTNDSLTDESPLRSCDESGIRDGFCLPSAPYATQIGFHNITLSWETLNSSDVVYIPQWTGPRLSGVWTQDKNVREPPYTVENLQPYSLYKFRILAAVSEIYTYSQESSFYQTEPFGVPSSPVIESVESYSGESVDVSWSSPEIPGGPIVGYNLNLTAHGHGITVTTGGNVFFITFYPTLHDTTYRISIAAVNREGQGANAEANVTTPPRPEQKGGPLVFASRLNSLRQRAEDADFFTPAECLPDGLIEGNITGMAVYHESSRVYFSEGGHIWVKGVENLTDHSDLSLLHSAQKDVTALSVDWLYKKLYFISDATVHYCKLDDCSSPVDFNLQLASSPKRIIADPYNGWLFLLLHNGIHRVSLPETMSHADNLTHVVKMDSMHDFVVSFPNKRLVFYNQEDQTLLALSLDGTLPISVYSNINYDAQSLAYEDGLLMLTDGHAVYKQTGTGQEAFFFEFSMDCDINHPSYGGFGNLQFFSPLSQLYPVPKRPRDLQVLFGSNTASLHWNKPEITTMSSPSAWQNWTYSVRCVANKSVVSDITNINSTQTTVPELRSGQQYIFTVWASSPAGHSHTVSFQGTTLHPDLDGPYIAAASDKGLWRQELDNFGFLKPLDVRVIDVKDIDWYNNTLFWTNSSGHISWMDIDDHSSVGEIFIVPQNMKAEAVAYDWLGQYLYWSCNTSMICRGLVSGQDVEVFLSVQQKIQDLLIDAPNAAIYWTTETTLGVCRLDGERCHLLEKLSVFSGSKIAGIAADLTEGVLYWLVQDGSFLHLYRSHINSENLANSKGTQFLKWSSSEVLNNQLAYYSGRLVWLDNNKKLRIQEVTQTRSVLMSPGNTLTAFALLQKRLKPLPEGFVYPPSVIPSTVPETSIHLERNHTAFRVFWEPSRTEFGLVFYCVSSYPNDLQLFETKTENVFPSQYCSSNTFSEPVVQVEKFKPNTKFNITITPYTYWGRGGSTSKILLTPDKDTPSEANTLLITMSAILSVLLVLIVIVAAIICSRKKRKNQSETNLQISLQCQDRELEEIRGLVGLGNACYAVSALPIHQEIESLPVFPRDRLKLQRLLGSGAFGEVFEGITTGNHNTEGITEQRVAVKTLCKGATDQEKIEFLKEAHLMSQFNHPNILRLLGVCLLNKPCYLILELMEGGDLRSYLRGARATNNHGQLLNLTSLLEISLDVATGCAYLEKLHFVHRDLAARNCLVSVRGYTDPERVVKIGDFGLARDVYKNDYYRKKGEGLLPVRWMPPESLTDGIFNVHSDVWSFGVLLWEIVTLGMQPYPALSNQEVLHHVNTGGRLLIPAGCSQKLYNVMMHCWKMEPSERPSFHCLMRTLQKLIETETLTQDGKSGIVNQAYQEDEEEVCREVDADEGLEMGLTHVVSNEGLNYLMYRPEEAENTDRSSSPTESLSPTEDR